MKQFNIATREDLMQFLQTNFETVGRPALQCEFSLNLIRSEIYGQTGYSRDEDYELDKILIQSFNFPALGISWSNDPSIYGLVKPDVMLDSVKFTFLSDIIANKILKVRESYYSNGLLAFPSEHRLYTAEFNCHLGYGANVPMENTYKLAVLSNCRFSEPIPSPNPTSSEFATWSCELTYETYSKE